MKIIHETDAEVVYLKEPDSELINKIESKFGITPLTAKIIANRGMKSMEEIANFLHPRLKNIPSPFLFEDMGKIVDRIYTSVIQKESVLIYGDYDVDGITSTTLLLKFFETFSYPVRYYIPDRFSDGYGLNGQRLIELYQKSTFHLLITVDCGITGNDVIKELAKLGVDTIVTDHHRAETKPDGAFGVLDPSLEGCHFPYKHLAGVGVAFFLLIALRSYLREKGFWQVRQIAEPDLRQFLDIVCIGTIADMVPLHDVNRILVNSGLDMLAATRNLGLSHFLEALKLSRKDTIMPWEVSFQIAPRINAAGRLASGTIGVSLLTARDSSVARSISQKLENLNRKRQALENKLLEDTKNMIESNSGYISPFAIILWDEKWHEGVIGIVASKLVEAYGRPVALIHFDGELGKGSLRGIAGSDIYRALQYCSSYLVSFGGHALAGGIKVNKPDLPLFAEQFSSAIENQLGGILPKKQWVLDEIIYAGGIPDRFFMELEKLEPFGIGNPPPLLGFFNFQVKSKKLLQEKHIRLTIKHRNGKAIQAIAFNAENYWIEVDRISGIIGVPGINRWNGNTIPQINIKRFLHAQIS